MGSPRSPRARRLLRRRERRRTVDSRAAVAANERDGRLWTIGSAETVAWIQAGTTGGCVITSAIPPGFAAYATIVEPSPTYSADDAWRRQEIALLSVLRQFGSPRWWLGYLDTGSDDVVFPRATKTTLYADWRYVLVEAGRDEAMTWRDTLPDLIFPADRSWMVSTLWDDTWTCVAGSEELLARLDDEPLIRPRRVGLGDNVAPPGHSCI